MSLVAEAFQDALIDTLKLIPFLFVTYLLMEALEHHAGKKSVDLLARMGKAGPVYGGLFGIVPQCGFSASAASLYAGGVITLGTMLAVFLSTSDEMLPILISEHVDAGRVLRILGLKAVIGVVSGLAVDAVFRKAKKTEHHVHDLCEETHRDYSDEEHEGIFRAALMHTLQIVIFIFIISFLLTTAVDAVGQERLASLLAGKPVFGVLIAAFIGLIPSCGASVALTQMYLAGLLSTGQMMAGLLVGAGVGLLVLYRTNHHHVQENVRITVLLYCIGVFWGLILEGLGVTL